MEEKENTPPPLTIQGIGILIELMSGRTLVEKYVDTRDLVLLFTSTTFL